MRERVGHGRDDRGLVTVCVHDVDGAGEPHDAVPVHETARGAARPPWTGHSRCASGQPKVCARGVRRHDLDVVAQVAEPVDEVSTCAPTPPVDRPSTMRILMWPRPPPRRHVAGRLTRVRTDGSIVTARPSMTRRATRPTPSPTTTLEPNDCPTHRPLTDSHEATPRPAPAPMTAAVRAATTGLAAARAPAAPGPPDEHDEQRGPEGQTGAGTAANARRSAGLRHRRRRGRRAAARPRRASPWRRGLLRRAATRGRRTLSREETDDAEADDRGGEERHRVAHRRQGLERGVGPGAGAGR